MVFFKTSLRFKNYFVSALKPVALTKQAQLTFIQFCCPLFECQKLKSTYILLTAGRVHASAPMHKVKDPFYTLHKHNFIYRYQFAVGRTVTSNFAITNFCLSAQCFNFSSAEL